MKKLKLSLKGITPLTKEQMKTINGGNGTFCKVTYYGDMDTTEILCPGVLSPYDCLQEVYQMCGNPMPSFNLCVPDPWSCGYFQGSEGGN